MMELDVYNSCCLCSYLELWHFPDPRVSLGYRYSIVMELVGQLGSQGQGP